MQEFNTTEEIKQAMQTAMQNTLAALKHQLEKLHTGRASPALVESIRVTTSTAIQPLNHLATITVLNAQTLEITPFVKEDTASIDKAIRKAQPNINPVSMVGSLKITLPALSEERRKEFAKSLKQQSEAMCNEIRNHRRTANQQSKVLQQQKKISEDQEKRAYNEIQKITNNFIEKINKLVVEKEKNIMSL